MNILLVYPYCLEDRLHEEEVSVPPIGLYYVAAMLRAHGHGVEVADWHHLRGSPETVREELRAAHPDVIGVSVLHANRWGAVEIARTAKELDPSVTVVFGGVGATFLWEHVLTHFPEVDCVVTGEGECSFLELVRRLDSGSGLDPEGIPGVAFREAGRAVMPEPAGRMEDLDRLPNPARYFTFQHVASSRGCPGNCTFCGSPRFWGRKVRFHSPDYFVEQLELLYRKGVSFFYVSDDTFTLDGDRVAAICRGILARRLPITWAAISRVDRVDEEMLSLMRQAGCVQISYGVESGSERIRRRLNKGFTTAQIRRAFELTVRYGILARAYFIYGCPGESDESIDETLELISDIKPLAAIFYILDVFPGTTLYERFTKSSGCSDDIWLQKIEDILYFETDPAMDRGDILRFGRALREGFHRSLPSYVNDLRLVDREELYPYHADFLSRLAMTFSHGDYAKIDVIDDAGGIAETLYRRALGYYPDHRAFLGLGILAQKRGNYRESARILEEGCGAFPHSAQLLICLAVTHMNTGAYENALACLERCEHSQEADRYADVCRKALNRGHRPP